MECENCKKTNEILRQYKSLVYILDNRIKVSEQKRKFEDLKNKFFIKCCDEELKSLQEKEGKLIADIYLLITGKK